MCGSSAPLGATVFDGGVNFSLFAKHATRDAGRHRTSNYWHARIPGVQPGQVYGYLVHGPDAPDRGLRFDPQKVLFDPYGRAMAVPGSVQDSG